MADSFGKIFFGEGWVGVRYIAHGLDFVRYSLSHGCLC